MSEILITPDGNIHQIDSGPTLPLIPGGIELRDFLAAHIAAGTLAHKSPLPGDKAPSWAAHVYRLADLLLEARKK